MARTPLTHTVIRASAGTGKTFQLTNRYLALAAAGRPLDEILATTFTRKAAGEILDRIIFRLADAATDPGRLAELAVHMAPHVKANENNDNDGPEPLSPTQAMRLLRRLLHSLHRLRVGTLDSFFIQMVRGFSLDLGFPPGWKICDEIEDRQNRIEAVRRVLSEGKTEDVVRLMHMLHKGDVGRGVSQQLLDLVTQLWSLFRESDKDAWTQLKRLPFPPDDLVRQSLIDFESAPLPKHKSFEKARNKSLEFGIQSDWLAFLASGLIGKIIEGEETYYRKEIPPELIQASGPLIEAARAHLLNMIVDQNEATYELLSRFDEVYSRMKSTSRRYRFEDMTAALALRNVTGAVDEISYRLDGNVEHLLLDEFQDTAPLQWRVLEPFARHITSGDENAINSFFCVGDVKQAIYGWRGGVAEIFDSVEQSLDGLKVESLNQSFRSSPPVIETVNRIFSRLIGNQALSDEEHSEAAERWGQRFQHHETARTELVGFCRLSTAPIAETPDQPEDSDGSTSKAPKGPSKAEQEVATLEHASELIAQLSAAAPESSIGVLVRKNKTVGRLIALLHRKGVDASEEGGNPLTDSQGVNLILSALKIAEHPGDTAARFHVATSLLGRILEFEDYASDEAASRLAIRLRRRIADDGYGKTIRALAHNTAKACDVRDWRRVEQFIELAYAYESRATDRIDDFLFFVELQRVESPTSAPVRVMTVHQSKGLQFDVVVLPELDEKLQGQPSRSVVDRPNPAAPAKRICRYVNQDERRLLPEPFQKMFGSEKRRRIEESLCVLYVAITRAVHGLYMITPPPSDSEKSLPKTWAGLLRGALAEEGPHSENSILFECGDPDWLDRLPASTLSPITEQAEQEDEAPTTVRLRSSKEATPRCLEHETPSQLEGGRRVDLSKRLGTEQGRGREWGTVVHAMLETIGWIDQTEPDENVALEAAQKAAPRAFENQELLNAFQRYIASPAVRRVLSLSEYSQIPTDQSTPVHLQSGLSSPSWKVLRERPFAVRRGTTLLKGSIDRLVVLFDGDRPVGADVVDFKTDNVDPVDHPDEFQRITAHYEPQLQAYRDAVALMYGLPKKQISARLLFVGSDVVHTFR
jgi:ATP-dependent helicase/nuclease subunit A